MAWTDRLNGNAVRLHIGGGRVEVLYWAHERHLADNAPHRHTFYEACLVGDHGQGIFTNSGTDYRLEPGTFFVARPGVTHQIRNRTGVPNMELFWVAFSWHPTETTPRSEAEQVMNAFVASNRDVAYDEGGRLRSVWDALRAVATEGLAEQNRAMAATLLVQMATTLAPNREQPDPEGPRDLVARLATRYIADNLNRPLSLEEIANQVHVSPRHLSRLFTAATGSSPLRYVMVARLDRASALLSGSDTPIKEIAERIGFADVHHFTRCFTRHFGTPPAAYRRHARRGQNEQNSGTSV